MRILRDRELRWGKMVDEFHLAGCDAIHASDRFPLQEREDYAVHKLACISCTRRIMSMDQAIHELTALPQSRLRHRSHMCWAARPQRPENSTLDHVAINGHDPKTRDPPMPRLLLPRTLRFLPIHHMANPHNQPSRPQHTRMQKVDSQRERNSQVILTMQLRIPQVLPHVRQQEMHLLLLPS